MTREPNATETTMSKQRRAQIAAKARGDCIQCFKPRGMLGTKDRCRKCADKFAKYLQEYRRRKIDKAKT